MIEGGLRIIEQGEKDPGKIVSGGSEDDVVDNTGNQENGEQMQFPPLSFAEYLFVILSPERIDTLMGLLEEPGARTLTPSALWNIHHCENPLRTMLLYQIRIGQYNLLLMDVDKNMTSIQINPLYRNVLMEVLPKIRDLIRSDSLFHYMGRTSTDPLLYQLNLINFLHYLTTQHYQGPINIREITFLRGPQGKPLSKAGFLNFFRKMDSLGFVTYLPGTKYRKSQMTISDEQREKSEHIINTIELINMDFERIRDEGLARMFMLMQNGGLVNQDIDNVFLEGTRGYNHILAQLSKGDKAEIKGGAYTERKYKGKLLAVIASASRRAYMNGEQLEPLVKLVQTILLNYGGNGIDAENLAHQMVIETTEIAKVFLLIQKGGVIIDDNIILSDDPRFRSVMDDLNVDFISFVQGGIISQQIQNEHTNVIVRPQEGVDPNRYGIILSRLSAYLRRHGIKDADKVVRSFVT